MGSEMEERERWRRERRHEEETTQQGWTVIVHSLYRISVTFETIHDPMAPYLPSPWPLGTSLSAFAQVVPSPDPHAPDVIEHIPGVANDSADYLPRSSDEDTCVPKFLKTGDCITIPDRAEEWWKVPPYLG